MSVLQNPCLTTQTHDCMISLASWNMNSGVEYEQWDRNTALSEQKEANRSGRGYE